MIYVVTVTTCKLHRPSSNKLFPFNQRGKQREEKRQIVNSDYLVIQSNSPLVHLFCVFSFLFTRSCLNETFTCAAFYGESISIFLQFAKLQTCPSKAKHIQLNRVLNYIWNVSISRWQLHSCRVCSDWIIQSFLFLANCEKIKISKFDYASSCVVLVMHWKSNANVSRKA